MAPGRPTNHFAGVGVSETLLFEQKQDLATWMHGKGLAVMVNRFITIKEYDP